MYEHLKNGSRMYFGDPFFFLITVIWNRDRQQEIQIVYKSAIQRFMFEFDPWSFQRGWGRICISYYRSSSLVTWFKIFLSQKCQ